MPFPLYFQELRSSDAGDVEIPCMACFAAAFIAADRISRAGATGLHVTAAGGHHYSRSLAVHPLRR